MCDVVETTCVTVSMYVCTGMCICVCVCVYVIVRVCVGVYNGVCA